MRGEVDGIRSRSALPHALQGVRHGDQLSDEGEELARDVVVHHRALRDLGANAGQEASCAQERFTHAEARLVGGVPDFQALALSPDDRS